MKKFIEFIANIYKSDTNESSKRFFGSIGFLAAIVFIALWDRSLINELMYTSAGMVGFDAILKMVEHLRKKK